ncbi:MAG: PAS domain S-box protein [Candidatus Binataceae bacterium]
MLASRQPMFIAWGREQTWLYNDAFIPILGRKHPYALGRPALDEVWKEATDTLAPLFAQVYAGQAVHMDDIAIALDRTGRLDEAHFSFSYTPVKDEDGTVAGLFGVCTETTALLQAQRSQQRADANFQAATEELRGASERVTLALDAGAIIGTWVWRVRDNVFLADEQFAKAFGTDPEVCHSGLPIEKVMVSIHPDDLERVRAAVNDALTHGGAYRCQYRVLRPDGRYRWIEASGRVEQDATGAALRFPGVLIDIDEARAVEQALREAEERLRIAQEAAQIGSFEWYPDSDEFVASDQYCRLLGFAPGTRVRGADVLARVVPEDQGLSAPIRLSERQPVIDDIEYRIRRADTGEVRWLARRGKMIDAADGRQRMMGVVYDITERRRAEERLQSVLDSVTDGFVGVDGDGHITLFNRAAELHFGVSAARLIGKPFWEEFADVIGSPIEAAIRRAVAVQQPVTFETESIRRPGRQIELRIAPKRGGGVAISFSDVTERHQSERNRELLVNELNHRVKNSLAIVQSIAHQSLKRADVAGDVRDSFMARLSALAAAHDVLTQRNWESINLRELVQATMTAFSHASRITVDGPDLRLRAQTAVSVSLAIHELATNAAKYGALSNERGSVSIVWSTTGRGDEARLNFVWREADGPVVAPPSRRGFGSRMIESALASDLGGTVTMDFAPTGLVCTVEAPLHRT